MWPGEYLYSSVRRSIGPRHGIVQWVSASVKITTSPAAIATSATIDGSGWGGRAKAALWLPGTQPKPPSPGRWSTSAHCTATSPLYIRPPSTAVVLRRVVWRAATVQAEAGAVGCHGDAVGVVEADGRAAQLDQRFEHGVMVDELAEGLVVAQVPAEALAARSRRPDAAVQLDHGQAQHAHLVRRERTAPHDVAVEVERVALAVGERTGFR